MFDLLTITILGFFIAVSMCVCAFGVYVFVFHEKNLEREALNTKAKFLWNLGAVTVAISIGSTALMIMVGLGRFVMAL